MIDTKYNPHRHIFLFRTWVEQCSVILGLELLGVTRKCVFHVQLNLCTAAAAFFLYERPHNIKVTI